MKTILLADDEPNIRLLIHTTLDSGKYQILEAADGAAAIELARSALPDLVVLDWMMPGMTGLEVTRALRQDSATARIPIIMLSAKGQPSDRSLGLATGVSAYISKPFSPLDLLAKVEEFLGLAEGAR